MYTYLNRSLLYAQTIILIPTPVVLTGLDQRIASSNMVLVLTREYYLRQVW